jgi:crotonobetainyl-CoA:carnitine CoA-transferase CaiB-like acyl-CoA transferase
VEDVFWFEGELGKTLGMVTEARHPILDAYPRLQPTVRFSRSATITGDAPLRGQDTIAVLHELGMSTERIQALRQSKVVATADD